LCGVRIESIVCPYCDERIPKNSKVCEYCFGEIMDKNIDSSTLSQETNNLNHDFNQNGEFEKYIIRLQQYLVNPELIDLPSFKGVYLYRESDMFAYVKYIPNISTNIANKFIEESINRTDQSSGFIENFVPPISTHVMVSENVGPEMKSFILHSKDNNLILVKNTLLMSAIYDLSNHTLYYKERNSLLGFLRNSSINKFIRKFDV